MVGKVSNSEKTIEEQYSDVSARELSSAYAFMMTKLFRKKTVDCDKAPPIFYVPPVIYVLESEF